MSKKEDRMPNRPRAKPTSERTDESTASAGKSAAQQAAFIPGGKVSRAPEACTARRRFPIVGVGASAGGLEAFSELLRHLPPRTGMAFVFVQHLDPTHGSMLRDLLARASSMPVEEAQNDRTIEPDHLS
jgi:two-component system CheB/CheR fusion protein